MHATWLDITLEEVETFLGDRGICVLYTTIRYDEMSTTQCIKAYRIHEDDPNGYQAIQRGFSGKKWAKLRS